MCREEGYKYNYSSDKNITLKLFIWLPFRFFFPSSYNLARWVSLPTMMMTNHHTQRILALGDSFYMELQSTLTGFHSSLSASKGK